MLSQRSMLSNIILQGWIKALVTITIIDHSNLILFDFPRNPMIGFGNFQSAHTVIIISVCGFGLA